MKKLQIISAALLAAMAITTSCDNPETEISIAAMELDVLTDLYESTNGGNWTNNENWLSDAPLEDWYGVVTDSQGNIIGLDLSNNQLDGGIPSSIGSLSNLGELNLSNNQLESSIPSSIGSLSNLGELNLSNNQLESSIPSSIGSLSNLGELNLSNNQLESSIPSSIGSLSSLTGLNLSNNQLSSEIPSEIGSLSNLEYLNLGYNELEGSIPESIGNLSNLTVLDLSYNGISGEIPETFVNLTSLTDLYLQETDLTGEVPQELIEQGVNVVVDLELVIPEDLIGDMANHMPIYEGINPPNIEGCYLMDLMTVVFCEDNMWSAGTTGFYDEYFEFYDFDETYLTLMIKEETATTTGEGSGAYIRGDGDNFTAYFDVYGTYNSDYGNTVAIRQATVISGTLTTSGIKDMYYAFVMVSKDNDIYDELMSEDVYRVFYEGDDLASKVTTTLSLTKSGVESDANLRSIIGRAK